MTTLTAPALRTVTFGDLDAGFWGAAWGGGDPFLAVGILQPEAVLTRPSSRLSGSGPAEDWTLEGDGVEITLSPESEPASTAGVDGFDQLCRAHGQFSLAGTEHRVNCLGRRAGRPELDLGSLGSLRDVSAWFDPAAGIAVTALRPRGVAGHGQDILSAAVFEASGALAVSDPRLSTTYTAEGIPARASLELWLQGDDEDSEPYPRRAAGEAVGAHAAFLQDQLEVEAYPFRWHSAGQDGTGVYVLARPA